VLDGGQRSSAEVFCSFSPSGQTLLAETALGLMAVIVSVRQVWLRRQHPTVSIPTTVTHTMGGFARDVARRFSLGGRTYSHIAHMEALLRADRFFGVSLLCLQQTEASFLAAFVLAGSTAVTFELFSQEWLRNQVRVAAAQEGRRASAAASAARVAALGVFSSKTGRPDGMGMNIAGGAAEVQAQALEYGLTPAEVAEAARGTNAFFHQRVVALASALANWGKTNSNKATTNPDALRLGEQVGLEVMGPERWKKYITTSAKRMDTADKPAPGPIAIQRASARPVDECKGWVFHHITMTASRWTMTDQITYTLPGSTKENPLTHVESL